MWLLDKLDQSLSHNRNEAVHAPLDFFTGLFESNISQTRIAPDTHSGSPLASRLSEKGDLLQEFKYYRDYAACLSDYVLALFTCLRVRDHGQAYWPWPDRPRLPNRARPRPGRHHLAVKKEILNDRRGHRILKRQRAIKKLDRLTGEFGKSRGKAGMLQSCHGGAQCLDVVDRLDEAGKRPPASPPNDGRSLTAHWGATPASRSSAPIARLADLTRCGSGSKAGWPIPAWP